MPPYSSILSFGQQQPQFGLGGDLSAYAMPSSQSLSALGNGGNSFDFTKGGPGAGGGTDQGTNWFGRDGYLSTGIQGLQALSGAYLGFKQLAQAKDALNFQKKAYNTNLTNSVQTYNNSLQDRINGRTADYAGKEGDVQAYLASHELKKPGG